MLTQSKPDHLSGVISILLIEDDEDDFLITQDLLEDIESCTYYLTWINTYDRALKSLPIFNDYDVILVDYYIGGNIGLELIKEATVRGVKPPLVIMTGLGDRERDVQAIQYGAADYLVKGRINADTLERSLRYAIERKRIELVLRENEERFRKIARQERIINHLSQHIHQSLNLNEILDKTVLEITSSLELEHSMILSYDIVQENQYSYEVLAESRSFLTTNLSKRQEPSIQNLLNSILSHIDRTLSPFSCCLLPHPALPLEVQSMQSTYIATQISHFDFTRVELNNKDHLFFPIVVAIPIINQDLNKNIVLLCEKWQNFCDVTQSWVEGCLELLGTVSNQLKVAIKQSQLYEQVKSSREQSEKLLLNVLPFRIANLLKKTRPGILAESFKSVGVLFADIVNFTEIFSDTSPQDMVTKLDLIFSEFDALSERYNVEKIKTIGDAYMAFSGIPNATLDYLTGLADMALNMQKVIQNFYQPNGEPFSLRIGLHTGEAVGGVIGRRKFIYDLWGDTVNVASRMESSGTAGQIQVTAVVYEALRPTHCLLPRGTIKIKGKGTMQTYWLIGRK